MIVPSKRLLWLVALVGVPAAFLLGLVGVPLEVIGLGALVALGVIALDAPSALGRLRQISVTFPTQIRTSKGKTFSIEAILTQPDTACRVLHAGLPFPPQFEPKDNAITSIVMPEDNRTVAVRWQARAIERGRFVIPTCHVETASRLGFWEGRRTLPCESEIRIFPDLSRERHVLAPLFFRRGAVGLHQVRQVGKGREFEQLRSYLPGDSYSDVYWKGTAKRHFPVTMVHQIERTQEVHVVVDISRRSARELEGLTHSRSHNKEPLASTQCERFLQAAMVIALAAQQQGDRFGLITFSDQVHTTLPAARGHAHYNACRDALYQLQPRRVSPDYEELFIHLGNRLRQRALVILLTDLGEPWLAETFAESVGLAARKHVILVQQLGSPDVQPLFQKGDQLHDADELYPKLAGHLMWAGLQDTTRSLKQAGVHLTSSSQENLVADAVTNYLNVKKRQLI